MTILIDTNVLLDLIQRRAPHDAPATRVWQRVKAGQAVGWVAAITFYNIFYLAAKQSDRSSALQAVAAVRSTFRMDAMDESILDRAIDIAALDLEDAIQIASAEAASAHLIVTRNVRDFRGSSVRAVSPAEFLAIVE